MTTETNTVYDVGDIPLARADSANVPVNIFISPTDVDEDYGVYDNEGNSVPLPAWRLNAANFMPRKQVISDASYRVYSNNRDALVALAQKHIVPLYEAALKNLNTLGTNIDKYQTSYNYYWKHTEEPTIPGGER